MRALNVASPSEKPGCKLQLLAKLLKVVFVKGYKMYVAYRTKIGSLPDKDKINILPIITIKSSSNLVAVTGGHLHMYFLIDPYCSPETKTLTINSFFCVCVEMDAINLYHATKLA